MSEPESRVGCRRRPYILKCDKCGRYFPAKRKDAKFCSTRCRMYAHRSKAKN